MPLITPYLTPFDYGIIGIINSYSGIVGMIAVMGLNLHLTNSFYTHKNHFRKVWSRILGMLLISGLCFSVTYGAIMFLVLTQISGLVKLITILCACVPIALTANVTLAQHYYPLIYKPRPLVLRNLAASVVGLAVTFVTIYYLRLGFMGWVFGSAAAAITGFTLFIEPIWFHEQIKPTWNISRKRAVKWLRISLPIIPHSLGFVLLSSSDRIIMDWLDVSIDDIGLYSNGYIMGEYSIVIISAMIVAVVPRIQELYRESNFEKLRKLFFFCQTGALTVAMLLAMWMPQIYTLLVRNEQLWPAAWVAIFSCFSNAAYPFYSFISTAAFIEEKTKKILWLVFIPAALNIVLNFTFIPIYGYKAAIFTTLAAYWSQLAIPYFVGYFKHKTLLIMGNLRIPVILLLVLVSVTLFTYVASEISVFAKLIITVFILGGIFFYISKQKSL